MVNRALQVLLVTIIVGACLEAGAVWVFAQDSGTGDTAKGDPKVPCTDPAAPSLTLRKEDWDNNRWRLFATYGTVSHPSHNISIVFRRTGGPSRSADETSAVERGSATGGTRERTVHGPGTYGAKVQTAAERGGNLCDSDWVEKEVDVPGPTPTPTPPTPTPPPPTPTSEPCQGCGLTPTPRPTEEPTRRPTPTPLPHCPPECNPPTPTATPTLHAPGGLGFRYYWGSADKNHNRIKVFWDEVDIEDVKYDVEFKLVRDRLPDHWNLLPFDDYSINGNSKEDLSKGDFVDITEPNAIIRPLDVGTKYEFRVRTRLGDDDDNVSGWSRWTSLLIKYPFYGQQADHTVQYKIIQPVVTLGADFPPDYDPVEEMRIATQHGLKAWNNSGVASSWPRIEFCEAGPACDHRLNDNKTVEIRMERNISCRDKGYACVNPTTDGVGHLNNARLRVDQLPRNWKDGQGRYYEDAEFVVWTHHWRDHHTKTLEDSNHLLLYLPDVMTHELGHTLGLGHHPDGDAIMGNDRKKLFTNLPQKDQDYLREVYRQHRAR